VVNSSAACSSFPSVVDPFVLTNGGILSNAELPLGLRYFAACQMFASSARKSFQCVLFCFRIGKRRSLCAR